ncbi:MAG: response regulator [Erysipelotrichaceae bacterium]|nr:response regulator [Erysipelotrichaceae bacterium]
MKVIIVDDEVRVGTLIKNLIEWEELGLQLVGVFQNGYDVLEKFKTEPADILLCDIEMPDISGLDLVRLITQQYPSTRCVIISGFRNFEYARQAMQYGVDHYILKPVDEEELNSTLRLLSQSSPPKDSAAVSRENILNLLLEGRWQPESAAEINRKYGYSFASSPFHLVRIVSSSDRMMEIIMTTLMAKLPLLCSDFEISGQEKDSSLLLVNLNASASPESLTSLLYEALTNGEGTLNQRAQIFVSKGFEDLSELPQQLKLLKKASWQRLFLKENGIHHVDSDSAASEPLKLTDNENNRLMKAVESVDSEVLGKLISEMYQSRLDRLREDPSQVVALTELVAMSTFNKLYNLGVRSDDFALMRNRIDEGMIRAQDLDQLIETVSGLLYQDVRSKLVVHSDEDNDYVRQAKSYIQKNYNRNISLESLAQELNLNQTYVSSLFKEEAGINFKQYLTDVRIENAKRLLRETNMNISEIAFEIGYKNAFYFTSTFTAHEGIKPQEYRRIHRSTR